MSGNVRAVVTGLDWMGAGCRSIESTLEELVGSARRSLLVLAYRMSDGALPFLDLVRQRLRAGVQVTMVVNALSTHQGGAAAALRQLAHDYGNLFLLYEFRGQNGSELHAKAVIADDLSAIVGSANLSWNGLVKNYELAVHLEGEDVAEIARTARKLLTSTEVCRVT